MKKALQLSGKVNMVDQFCIPNILMLQALGYSVSVASDFSDPGSISKERAKEVVQRFDQLDVDVHDISFPRSLRIRSLFNAYKQVKLLFKTEHFDLVHCHSPIGAAVCRMAARKERKKGTKVIYTAHGFHFYKGAPIKNWLLYYPVEKVLGRYTDILITINKEDFERAKRKLHPKKIKYVPGVGVNTDTFFPGSGNGDKIREELGLRDSQLMILSVGELNENKNHERVIRAISGLGFVYVIVGKGKLDEKLSEVAKECGVDLRLMGYRSDVIDFYAAADVYVLPSIREGLNVSLMEAMASGLSVACGNIRGNVDLIEEPLFSPDKESEIKIAILKAVENKEEYGKRNREKIKGFSLEKINGMMHQIYKECEQ